MLKPDTLKRVTSTLVGLAIGNLSLSSCGLASAEPNNCYPGVVQQSVTESVHNIVLEHGHQLNDMIDMNTAVSAIESSLINLHQHAKHRYATDLPGDTFQVCIAGNEVTAGKKISVIDQ
jgi:hypothetical protein